MDNTQDGRWLTYAELATIRGINRASAVKLVQRERWRRSSGNDRSRTVRVLVPPDWLAPAKERPPASGDVPAMFGEYPRLLAAAETRADEAHKRAEAALALAERTLTQLADANARTDRAEDATDALRRHVTAIQAELDAARAEAQEAAGAVATLRQVEVERKARGLLARLRAAWRGR
jgi:hypothetical protein